MIPYLNQKIWFAFQGLPVEKINSSDRLPWPKCLVLTNNLMYILQFNRLTEEFRICVNKASAEASKGVTFKEYKSFIDKYLKDQNIYEKFKQNDSGSQPISNLYLPLLDQQNRPIGNLLESHSAISKTTTSKGYNKSESDILSIIQNFNDFCWTLYRTKHLPKISNQPSLQSAFLDLWLIFIMYALKCRKTGEIKIPVKMDLLEAGYWCSRIRDLLGLKKQLDNMEIQETVAGIEYSEFHLMMQNIFNSATLSESAIKIAIHDLAGEALEGVTMKGLLKIDRYSRFCVLKSFVLMIYNSKVNETHFRCSYVISEDTLLLVVNNKIQLKTSALGLNSTITIEVSDLQVFNKWRSAFTEAIEYSKYNILNPAIKESNMREEVWNEKRYILKSNRINIEQRFEEERLERSKLTEAMESRLLLADKKLYNFRQRMEKELQAKEILIKENEDIRLKTEAQIKVIYKEQQYQYNVQLEKVKEIELEKNYLHEKLNETLEEKSNEEMKRTLLEEKHLEAQKMLLEADEKINSLEKLREQLEKAFEEERKAKEDEERVRNATIELLEEEQRSKENLEILLQQQNSIIDQEILKRNEFARQLEYERDRIKKIAEEKEKLSKELEDTCQKTQYTGNRVRKLDTKVAKMAETIFGKQDTLMHISHRGQGFLAE